MSKLSTEFIDSCARELGSKRHRVELPWERKGLKDKTVRGHLGRVGGQEDALCLAVLEGDCTGQFLSH